MPPEAEKLSRVVEILKTLGQVCLTKNQYREAAEKYEQIIRFGVQDPEVYRHLAVALAGQKLYTPEAQRVYTWALEKFPHDKNICLHIAGAALQHRAEDQNAQRFYEAALKLHPPFAKDLYLHLHSMFHRQGKFDEAFQTLKQALYLDKTLDAHLVSRLTELGWHYDRRDELIMTLRFLLGNHEANPVIRRALAFTLAHAIIWQNRRRQVDQEDFLYGNENDWQLLQTSLPEPATVNTLALARDYCTLKWALLFWQKHQKSFSPASRALRPEENFLEITPPAFEYRALLDDLPLEEVLAETAVSATPPPSNAIAPQSAAARFDWRQSFLTPWATPQIEDKMSRSIKPPAIKNHLPPHANHSAVDATQALLVLTPTISPPGNSAPLNTHLAKMIDFIVQDFSSPAHLFIIRRLDDGVLAFSPEPAKLVNAALSLFKKIARYNTLLNEQNQIVLQAALFVKPAAPALTLEEQNFAGLGLLYDTLHLVNIGISKNEAGAPARSQPASGQSRLFVSRQIFEAVLPAEKFTIKSHGQVYWGAPSWRDEVYEILWHNPLDYVTEQKSYQLGRFRVTEKLRERRTYGTYGARDRSLERPVLLKALAPEFYTRWRGNPLQPSEMVEAIRRLGRLEHPGIAMIYDMGHEQDIFYFVREYVEGENLTDILAGQQRLSPPEILHWLIEICRILRYAHQQGAYHGNLKPSNIWRLKSATPDHAVTAHELLPLTQRTAGIKISDFFVPGFSEIGGSNWHYLAPEVLFRQKANGNGLPALQATADIYALGMMLFDCLYEKNPFKQINVPITRAMWEQVQLAPPLTMNHHYNDFILPPTCDEVILCAIHPDPQQRFQTAEELETAFRSILAELLKEASFITSLE